MGAVVLAEGARGHFVLLLQECLAGQGYPVGPVDGRYEFPTVAAVRLFQAENHMTPTGEADPETWSAITRLDPPSLRDRILQLTAAFEGHGFSLTRGNFDGTGITWGIIGFTLRSGELQTVVREALAQDRSLVMNAFGNEAPELLEVLKLEIRDQILWADRQSSGTYKMTLAEPWRSHFKAFGDSPAVQMLQIARVDEGYFQPALRTVEKLRLQSELGIALCFDIHVQNGGLAAEAARTIAVRRKAGMSEADLRVLIATTVASLVRSEYRNGVLDRKLAIARGGGIVKGMEFALRSWGLDESPVTAVAV